MKPGRTLVTGFPSSFLARRVVRKLLTTEPEGLVTCVVQAKFGARAEEARAARRGYFGGTFWQKPSTQSSIWLQQSAFVLHELPSAEHVPGGGGSPQTYLPVPGSFTH